MPTAIPYDPSLVLGGIVPPAKLTLLQTIGTYQSKIDSAQETLNNFIALKYSLDATQNELINMRINPAALEAKIESVKESIDKAAEAYATVSISENENIVQKKIEALEKEGIGGKVGASFESPVDYEQSKIESLPLSSDSLNMDSQYFSFGMNHQNSTAEMAAIKNFVSNSTRFLGVDQSEKTGKEAVNQVAKQREAHNVTGTLIVSVNCTHKKAAVFAPLVIDVDKAIQVWNQLFTDNKEQINKSNKALMSQLAQQHETADEPSLEIISGANYGSSFIGMIHLLDTTSTVTGENMDKVAASLQERLNIGSWFADESGEFGVDKRFADDVENLLSQQNITAHVSIVSVGCIPSIVSGEVQLGLKKFSDVDTKAVLNDLNALTDATSSDKGSVDADADAAKTGAKMMSIQNETISNLMGNLNKIDEKKNEMLNINSMMTALKNFCEKASEGSTGGVPINFYLKPLTRPLLAQLWINKYHPLEEENTTIPTKE